MNCNGECNILKKFYRCILSIVMTLCIPYFLFELKQQIIIIGCHLKLMYQTSSKEANAYVQ